MYILPLIGYLGVILGFGFLTLAIASGLYYLSELVEEHTVIARKILTRLIYAVIVSQVLLALVDRFPFWLSLVSIGSHVIYMGNLRHFPIVKLSDPLFLFSCSLVFANHFLWFRHFSKPPSHSRPSTDYYNRYEPSDVPTFTEIASYFGICVWLVPFALFVSLSASENVLPSMGSEYATGGDPRSAGATFGDGTGSGGGKRRKKGLIAAGVDRAMDWIGESGEALGLWTGDRSRRF